MHLRALRTLALVLLACAACRERSLSSTTDTPGADPPARYQGQPPAAPPPPAAPDLRHGGLVDVSGDDCTASTLVYTRVPGDTASIAFVNDGCFGERIFLGIDGVKRELKRAENLPLGEGGPYRDGDLRAQVTRGKLVRRTLDYLPPDSECTGEGESEYSAWYEARVRVWSPRGEHNFTGTLMRMECRR